MIRKVVIPAAGFGTRLTPATKEQPKEMLPIFSKGAHGEICLEPLLQLVFQQLHDAGFREFCFIIGRGKRAIEDHFTKDNGYTAMLKQRGKSEAAEHLENFYRRLSNSSLTWVNQPEPKGFGDAVLKAQSFVGSENFIVHGGDAYVISKDTDHLKRLMKVHSELEADATLLIRVVKNLKDHGVVEAEEVANGIFNVEKAVEKPEKPTSNLAIMPIYAFKPTILKALEQTEPGIDGEIQLTDAIQKLVEWSKKVYAIQLKPDEVRLDIGNPEVYWEALKFSYEYAKTGKLSIS